jgi:hypothetical protein
LIFEKYRGEFWLIEPVKKCILCRNVGLGAGIFWTRVGGIVAPQLSLLVRFAKMYRLSVMPFLILGRIILEKLYHATAVPVKCRACVYKSAPIDKNTLMYGHAELDILKIVDSFYGYSKLQLFHHSFFTRAK